MDKIEKMRARLAEISAESEAIVEGDSGYTDEQLTQIQALEAEFENLEKQIEAAVKVESIKSKTKASNGRKTQTESPAPRSPAIQVGNNLADRFGGFQSSAEFLTAVKKAGLTGQVDEKFRAAAGYEKVAEDGGFLVPEDISSAILKKLEVEESLMTRTTGIQVSGNSLTLNVDESQPWNQGIQAYWMAEGVPLTESKPSFKQVSWRLHKLGALVKATDELLEDATALQSYIQASAPNAFMNKINSAILNGNGVGKPTGIISSPFTVTVSKEGTQGADTVVASNVVKMYSRMFPSSRANAAWYINPAVEDQLRLMKDDNDQFLYLSPGGFGNQMSQSPYGTLLGRPVIPLMGSIPALGDLGDILFADLSYYYMIRKAGGIKSATSIHLLFDREQTAFRFSMRVDGKCPFQSPVTTENGGFTMSAFVQLEAR